MKINKQDLENLWLEITKIENIMERRVIIYNDVHSEIQHYKVLADDHPYRLFKLLGGDHSDVERFNWASEYWYDDYLWDNGEEYDESEADEWDEEERGIQRAYDTGHWYVTGLCTIEGPNHEKLFFELEYCEGYFEGIIGTPYDTDEEGNSHGILFF